MMLVSTPFSMKIYMVNPQIYQVIRYLLSFSLRRGLVCGS